MRARLLAVVSLVAALACEASSSDEDPATDSSATDSGGDGTNVDDGGNGDEDGGNGDEDGGPSTEGTDSSDASSGDDPAAGDCDDVELAPIEADPDQGFIDITEDCVALINEYRVMDGLEPFWVHEDGVCCSALEARQAWLDDTHHNGDYCDWRAQGAAGGGRNPNGTAYKSLEWVPRLFYGEKGDTFEESGGHYQAMMRPEPRGVACGWYGHDRDNHRVVVNYW